MNEIFIAVRNKLVTDLTVEIFDDVPQDNYEFNYVRMDTLVLNNNDTDFETGFNATIQIIAFTQYKGSKEIVDLALEIYNSLHRVTLPDTVTYGISTIHQEFSTIALEADGLTRQSIQRFNIIFEPL